MIVCKLTGRLDGLCTLLGVVSARLQLDAGQGIDEIMVPLNTEQAAALLKAERLSRFDMTIALSPTPGPLPVEPSASVN